MEQIIKIIEHYEEYLLALGLVGFIYWTHKKSLAEGHARHNKLKAAISEPSDANQLKFIMLQNESLVQISSELQTIKIGVIAFGFIWLGLTLGIYNF